MRKVFIGALLGFIVGCGGGGGGGGGSTPPPPPPPPTTATLRILNDYSGQYVSVINFYPTGNYDPTDYLGTVLFYGDDFFFVDIPPGTYDMVCWHVNTIGQMVDYYAQTSIAMSAGDDFTWYLDRTMGSGPDYDGTLIIE